MTRVLGIVGGTGPESTVDYYRSLIAGWRRRNPDGNYPRVIINSVDGGHVIRLLVEENYSEAAVPIAAAVRELAAAGAGAALIASNATHLTFDLVAPTAPIPMLHIVDAARDAAAARGHRRLGILGTRMILNSDLYPARFLARGMTVVAPRADEREYVHDIYLAELLNGEFRDETRDRLVSIVAAMRDRDGIDGVILGGTELALILTAPTYADVPILNTAQIHVDAALDWLLG